MTTKSSNLTGLRYAIQTALGTLPGTPTWYQLKPNSYGDFGAQVVTVGRDPIVDHRQVDKGTPVDVNANANFGADLTLDDFENLFPGFFFAAWRRKQNDAPTSVSSTGYVVADETDYAAGDLIFAEGFDDAENNGFKLVTSVDAGTSEVRCSGLAVDASPASGATIRKVGVETATGDLDVDASGANPVITSTVLDFTTLGLIPGEWIFVGGDATANKFGTAANNGFARIKSIAANALTLDKTAGTMVTENNTTLDIRLFYGDVLKNESDPANIVKTYYQFERKLDDAGYQYLPDCVANTLNLSFGTAAKVVAELGFVGTDQATQGSAKTGNRPSAGDKDVFNTTSDISRLRFGKTDFTGLTTYILNMSLTINNNVSGVKAIANMGAIGHAVGSFRVSGELECLFSSTDILDSIRAGDDATLDVALVKENAGLLYDIPLIGLGNGLLGVEKDQPIKIPVSLDAGRDATLDHTMLMVMFRYLPDAAE